MELSERAKTGLYSLVALFVVAIITFVVMFNMGYDGPTAAAQGTMYGIAAAALTNGFMSGRKTMRNFLQKRKEKKK